MVVNPSRSGRQRLSRIRDDALAGLGGHVVLVMEEDGKRSVDLAWAQAHLESVGFALQTRMLEGLPDAGIADEMLGSRTTQLLRQAEGALLLHCGCASRMPSAACQPGRSTIATVVRVCVRAAEGRQAGRATSTRLRPARLAR